MAIVHLSFNVIGTIVCLIIFSLISNILKPSLLDNPASHLGIAISHSAFNIICTILLYPAAGLLEKLALKIVPQTEDEKEEKIEIDERLLSTPSIALEQCSILVNQMAATTLKAYNRSLSLLDIYDAEIAEKVRKAEKLADKYEDTLGTFLAKLSTHATSDSDSRLSATLLKVIGDFERISDHAVNILESAEELKEKNIDLTADAEKELKHIINAVEEILQLSYNAFVNNDYETAVMVEPLEQVIDELKEYLRDCHIRRLQRGECTIEAGFVWSDLLTNLERTSDHCSNIALCIIDAKDNNMNHHASGKKIKKDKEHFVQQYYEYAEKYSFKD